MPEESFFSPGEWNVQCFRCGFKYKSSEVRRQWQGYWVCNRCWEPRLPQVFVRAVPDNPSVPFAQPESVVYVGPNFPYGLLTEDDAQIISENNLNLTTE